jgi:hypothetical protein
VKAARYADLSVTEGLTKDCAGSNNVVSSILHALVSTREGKAKTDTLRKKVPGSFAPKRMND